MKNRLIFKKLEAFVKAQNYTIEQIQDATPTQIKNQLNLSDEEFEQYEKWVDAIKELLIKNITEKAHGDWFSHVMADVKQKYPQATGAITSTDILIQFNEVI